MTSKSANRYSPELRERAVRMLLEQRDDYASEHAAIKSIAPKIGCSPDTLRTWLRQHEQNAGPASARLIHNEAGKIVRSVPSRPRLAAWPVPARARASVPQDRHPTRWHFLFKYGGV